ncbi:hypothetical protein FDZ71_03630 [bacterium]|nr:MAG: hypothetical protein FDZ71_03630 [bacterium]
MAITEELLDQLIKDYKKPEDLIGENGLLKQLTKRLLEKAMHAEIDLPRIIVPDFELVPHFSAVA